MNPAKKYLGYISAALALTVIALLGFSYAKSKGYETEVLALMPRLLADIPSRNQYSALGAYESCPTKKANNIEIQVTNPVQAELEFDCTFKNGPATVYAKIQRKDSEWELIKLQVSSDVFAPAFNKQLQPTAIAPAE